MATAIASLLEDFSPAPKGEPVGIEIMRKVKHPVETEPMPSPSPVDRQAELIRAVEAKVRAEEREAAQKRLEDALAVEKARHEEELKIQRVIWVEHEASQLAAQIVEGLGRVETVLCGRVANILKPFVSEAFRKQSIRELEEALATVLLRDDDRPIRIIGPEDVVQALRDKLGSHEGAIEFVPGDHPEVCVLVRDTAIQTHLTPWASRLEQALKAES